MIQGGRNLLEAERDMALRSTRLLGESGLGLTFDPDLHYDTLDALDQGDFDHLIWTQFRGAGKSTGITSWLIRNIALFRDFRGLVVSVDDDKATELVKMVRDGLEKLDRDRPEWFPPFESKSLWSMDGFEVLGRSRHFREPTLSAAGMRSFRDGPHYNCIVVDDGEDDKWTDGIEKMEATRGRETLLAPMCDQPIPWMRRPARLTASTFWNDNDLTMSILRSYGLVKDERQPDGSMRARIKNNDVSRIPLPGGKSYTVRVFYKPIEDEDGHPLFPRTHDAAWIASKRLEMRRKPDLYAAQYRLDPMPSENAKFPPEFFKFIDSLPKGLKGDFWCGLDLASSLKPGSDHTSFVVVYVTEEFHFYVMEATSEKLDGRDAIERLFTLHRSYPGIRFAAEEDRYASGLKLMIEEEMRQRRVLLDIEWINAHARTKKESRVEAVQPLFKNGWVTFLSGRADVLHDSLRRFPRGRKDPADAFANVYEKAQAAPPTKVEENLMDDWMSVFPTRRSRLGDMDAAPSSSQLRRLRAGDVPARLL